MTIKQNLIKILPLAIILVGLLTYSFMQAQWVGPGQNPPADNVSAPINVGGTYQAKLGDLGAFRMRASAYCNADGTKCLDANILTGGANDGDVSVIKDGGPGPARIYVGGVCFQPVAAVSCMWNWRGDGNDTAIFYTYDLTNPSSACVGNHSNYSSHSLVLAKCSGSMINNVPAYSWVVSSWYKPYQGGRNTGVVTNEVRNVTCKNKEGLIASDSSCRGTKPISTRPLP